MALALGHAARPARIVVDLGIGTGALARVAIVANHSPHHVPLAGTERL